MNNITRADITTDDGVKKALRIQGQASGLDVAIGLIFEMANFEEQTNG